MNQELRALQGTRWHEGSQDRCCDIGYRKDKPSKWKVCVRRRGMVWGLGWHARASVCLASRNSVIYERPTVDVRVLGYFPFGSLFF